MSLTPCPNFRHHLSEEAIANRYGYDLREVRKYLALANVSYKVLNALASDKIDLACVQAFTLTDDHARQDRILKLTTANRLFKFIGMDAYRAAGGTITGDLFAQEGEGYADDPELVERLADEKLDQLAEEAKAEGWGDVIAAMETPYNSYSWNRLYADVANRTYSEAEQALMDELSAKREARLAELGADNDPDFDPESDDLLIELEEEIERLGTVERLYSAEARASGRLLIVLNHQGGINRSAYSMKAQRAALRDRDGLPAPRPLYDARMTEELTRMRTVALQSEVASNQPLAFAVLLDALLPILTQRFAPDHAVQLRAGADIQEPCQHFDYNSMEMATPFDGVAELIGAAPQHAANRFDWILSLDHRDVLRMLAACSGALITATQAKYTDPARLETAHRIARAAKLDMRQHWASGIEFFDRIGKKALLSALTEACGEESAANCEKMKKSDLAAACAERIPGRGWLPPALITPDAPEIEAEEEEPGTFEEDEEAQELNDPECGAASDGEPLNDNISFAVAAE
jgi:ParB family chromosome partitioning protein